MNNKDRERALAKQSEIIQAAQSIQQGYMRFGKLVNTFRAQKDYEKLGFSSLEEWLASLKLGVSSTICRRLMHLVRRSRALDIPEARLHSIGLETAEVIVRARRADVPLLMEKAEKGASIVVIRHLAKHGISTPVQIKRALTFPDLTPDDVDTINQALSLAADCLPSGTGRSQCLRYMADFLLSAKLSQAA